LGVKKIKVEVEDDRGNRYTFSITHPISWDKIAQFIDLVEMMSGPVKAETFKAAEGIYTSTKGRSKFEKMIEIIKEKFPLNWFSSSEVQLAYEEKFKEPISLSTVSTYLSRYCDKGFLVREGPSNMLKYKLKVGVLVEGR
jgi:hypothetical protein